MFTFQSVLFARTYHGCDPLTFQWILRLVNINVHVTIPRLSVINSVRDRAYLQHRNTDTNFRSSGGDSSSLKLG